jgi:hypothetical protein
MFVARLSGKEVFNLRIGYIQPFVTANPMAGNLRIFITYCSRQKTSSLADGLEVTPDRLYSSNRIRSFMHRCKTKGVEWAIFSDKYGIWFPDEKHESYDKTPESVTEEEFELLLHNFDRRLNIYAEIWFYHNPARFHGLYRRLARESKLRKRIRLFSRLSNIA